MTAIEAAIAIRNVHSRCVFSWFPKPVFRLWTSARQLATDTRQGGSYVQAALHRDLRQAAQRGGPERIFAIFWRHCDAMATPNSADLDACLNALVRSQSAGTTFDSKDLLRLLWYLEHAIVTYNVSLDAGRFMTNVIWSLVRLARQRDSSLSPDVLAKLPAIFCHIENVAIPALGSSLVLPRHMATLAWAFARGGAGSPSLFSALWEATLRVYDRLLPREVSNVLWAFATAKVANPEAVTLVSQHLTANNGAMLTTCTEQDIANILWSYAVLQSRQPALFEATATHVLATRISDFTVRGLVTTIWAYASLREPAPFVEMAAEYISSGGRWEKLNSRSCATLLWALASLRYERWMDAFFASLVDRVIRPQSSIFQALDVSQSLWAFASVRVHNPQLFDALSKRAVQVIDAFNPKALATVAWSCAKMHAGSPSFFVALAEAPQRRPLGNWPPQPLTLACWSLAEVDAPRTEMLAAAAKEIVSRADAFSDIDLATLTRILRHDTGWHPTAHALRSAALARIESETTGRGLPRTREALHDNTPGSGGDPSAVEIEANHIV